MASFGRERILNAADFNLLVRANHQYSSEFSRADVTWPPVGTPGSQN